jgi:hypothetical protein
MFLTAAPSSCFKVSFSILSYLTAFFNTLSFLVAKFSLFWSDELPSEAVSSLVVAEDILDNKILIQFVMVLL